MFKRIRSLKVRQAAAWTAWVKGPSQWYKGRLLVVKRSCVSALRELRRRRRAASRCDRKLGRLGRMMAHYVMIRTSVDAREMPNREVFRVYQVRWQIELVFNRMKSIMGLGLLPKRTDGSSRAWLNGKLFVALLVEKLWRQAEHFFPWGYSDPTAAKPLA